MIKPTKKVPSLSNQFGFRKNNSTVFALAQISEMIKVSIDNRKFGCGIFVDLRKAFDTEP